MKHTNIYLVLFAVILSYCVSYEGNPDSLGIIPDESVVFSVDMTNFDGAVSIMKTF